MKGKGNRVVSLILGILFLAGMAGPLLQVEQARAQEAQPLESALPPAFCSSTVQVMPLGDSITRGGSGEVPDEEPEKMISYRKDLWDLLKAVNYSVDFVGSQTNGQFYAGFAANHEGHDGITDAQVATNIYNNGGANWLNLANPVDIILLHIGTNNLGPSAAEVEDILDEIDEYENSPIGNHVTVILARIINRVPPTNATTTFNNNVLTMAQARIANGDDIILVNMETGAGIIYTYWNDPDTPGDMYFNGTNGLHPYHTGYTKMARVWKEKGLDVLFQQCNKWPILTNPGSKTSVKGEPINLPIQATDPEGQTLTFSAANLPPGLGIHPSTGVISGTVALSANTSSPYQVTVTVTDNGKPKMSDREAFSWTISNSSNHPPVLADLNDREDKAGKSVSWQLSAADPDAGDQLTFSASGLPEGLSIDPDGLVHGVITATATLNSPYQVTVTVKDDGVPQLDDADTFVWTVLEQNHKVFLPVALSKER